MIAATLWAARGGRGGLALLAGAAGILPAVVVPLGLGRRLGSHSGDSYGACVEWVEALTLLLAGALLAAAARWGG